ncbi:MAG: DEAD/DEAH box helicase [Candidatus Omnitrophica bacterium]|nr:DEAD/DEAH box helicase [Candidatus Omnitrophota bacterium]
MTRSGDTDPVDRTRMLRRPPEILITTPESVNLLVGSIRGRSILTDLKTVILDEIHAVAGNKRGAHLITAVDRLAPLSGEFQRIALSATIRPLDRIAEWVGGRRMDERVGEIQYNRRSVQIIDCRQSKKFQIQIRFPHFPEKASDDPSFLSPLVVELKKSIRKNRSTLIFTNDRRLCERISFMLNQDEEHRIAYSHHGSLSRETRSIVEERLKKGELAAIVATSSLELGIDIGFLDEVLMVRTPPGIAAALQRIGRAGHRVGETSRGVLFPTHGRDLLDAAVIGRCVMDRDIEEIRPVQNPLDILAQIVASMCGVEEWDADRLYAFLQTSAPFFHLRREEYDLVLAMLSGRYSSKRMRHLRPLISWDRLDNTIRAREGALQKVWMEGGTIPDRGYFTLRHSDSRSKIGELDEEFVWERRVGDTFMLGTQVWKIQQITHNDVLASLTDEPARIAPFWRNEQVNRDFYCSEKIGLFLGEADRDLQRRSFRDRLLQDYSMNGGAADALIDFLMRQKKATCCGLPHRRRLVIEYTQIPGGKNDRMQGILHTVWGGRVNQPLSLILAAAYERRSGSHVDIVANNDGVLLSMTEDLSLSELLFSIQSGDIEKLLRLKLESSGFFGARFRENASRALLMPRGRFGRRTPLWLHRLRSKELLEAIGRYDDFPILIETWRTCLQDEFDLPTLKKLLMEIHTGDIQISEVHTSAPSPFSGSLTWIQTNALVYMGDASYTERASVLRDDLIHEAAGSADLRPEISSDLIRQLEKRLQRNIAGYAPDSEQDLLDWAKERLLIPEEEWESLCAVIRRIEDVCFNSLLASLSLKIVLVRLPKCACSSVVALEKIPYLLDSFGISKEDCRFYPLAGGDKEASIDWNKMQKIWDAEREADESCSLADWFGAWLAFYGPVSKSFISERLGIQGDVLEEAIQSLLEEERLIFGILRKDSTMEEICDRQNFEILLRMMRRESAPRFTPLPEEKLSCYLARQQGLAQRGETLDDLQNVLEPLLGFTAAAEMWERELLPSRMKHYIPSWMDDLTRDTDLMWYGSGKKNITLCFQNQIDLFFSQSPENRLPGQSKTYSGSSSCIFPDPRGKYEFSQLLESTQATSAQLTERLWEEVWQGRAGNDSFSALRKGIETKFKATDISFEHTRGRRSGFNRWRVSRPFSGNWFSIDSPMPAEDALELLERQKECVRTLLDRYGILFRNLLSREHPSWRWGVLFKAMRLMELSGELTGGYFFEGVGGIQFVRTNALDILQKGISENAIYWMNAADPASLCGIPLEGLPFQLPARRTTNHVVFHGANLVLTSMRQGRELDIRVEPAHPDLPAYYGLFADWLNRSFQPKRTISIETINGIAASASPYLSPLRELFHVAVDYKKVVLRKRYDR